MKKETWLEHWKYPSILLVGIGVSNVGGWIYFIALNLIVLEWTQSVLAVSILYLIRPLAAMFTNLWSGSLIDRINKRSFMIILDLLRAVLIVLLPLHVSVVYIYVLVFFIHMAGAVFGPASVAYTVKLIPPDRRQRFNSLNALIGSGAFMIGPAIAGILFLIGTPVLAIYINAGVMLFSGIIMWFMPNLEKDEDALDTKESHNNTWAVLKDDWGVVIRYYRSHVYITAVCLLFGSVMIVMASVVDSLEAAFAQEVLRLSNSAYGILVSVAGAGIVAGAGVNALVVKRLTILQMIRIGVIGVCAGYLIYAFSSTFAAAAVGFFILAFFLAYANAGFATFYQNNIPERMLGRIGSMNGFIEAVLIMVATTVFGLWAEWGSIRLAVVTGVILMVMLGIALCIVLYYKDTQLARKPRIGMK